MSKHDKTLERLCSLPPPSDIKWKDLETLLEHLGYEQLKGAGSRRKFYNKALDALICCHRPHPSPDVDKGCVRDVAEHLKLKNLDKGRKK